MRHPPFSAATTPAGGTRNQDIAQSCTVSGLSAQCPADGERRAADGARGLIHGEIRPGKDPLFVSTKLIEYDLRLKTSDT
jgi:hypothetical protein